MNYLFRRNTGLHKLKLGVVIMVVVGCSSWLTNVVVRGAEDFQRQAFARLLHNPILGVGRTAGLRAAPMNRLFLDKAYMSWYDRRSISVCIMMC
jgi:hypothetical protein